VTLTDVVVSDSKVTVDCGSFDGTLDPGEFIVCTGTYILLQSDVDAGQVYNSATVTGNDPQDVTVTDTDDNTEPLPKAASIDLVKEGTWNDLNSDGNADAGETISYTFTVTNTGNVTLTDVVVSDSKVTVDCGSFDGTLDPGEFIVCTGTYILLQSDVDAGQVYNSATVTGNDPQDVTVTDTDDNTEPLPKAASIDLVKEGTWNDLNSDGNADAGETISYTFTVTNTGNVTLTDVVVSDSKVTVDCGSFDGTLDPGEFIVCTGTYILLQSDVDAGQVYNSATVTGNDPQDVTVTDTDDNTEPLPKAASIDLVKEGTWNDLNSDGNADAGETISYTFTVTNTGNVTLTDVVVSDSKVTVDCGSFDGTLDPGEFIVCTGTYILLQSDVDAGQVYNSATVTGNDPQDVTVTDTDDNTEPLPKAASIDLVKEGTWNDLNSDGNADAGETISYTFTVTNTGNVTLTDVVVSDSKVTVDCGSFDGTLDPGEFIVCTGTYILLQSDVDAGQVYNSATVTGNDPQDVTVTDTDDNTEPLPKAASIDLVKEGTWNDLNSDGNADAGETISYTFTVTNTGNVTLTDVVVSDSKVTVDCGSFDGTLDPGEFIVCTGTYILLQSDVDAGQVYNSATVTGNDPQDVTVTDTDDNTEPLPKAASIDLVKEGTWNDLNSDGNADAGETISYTFTVTNTGNVTLTDVTVTDPLVTVSGGPIASMAPGEVDNTTFTAVYVLTQADINAGTFTNIATATGTPPFGSDVTDNDDDTQTLNINPVIAIIKTSSYNSGTGLITYTYNITNLGNVTLYDINVTENNGAFTGTGLLPVPIYSSGGADLDGDADAMDLAVGASLTWVATYAVTLADIDEGFVINQATATGYDPQGDPTSDLSDDNSNFEDDPTRTPLVNAVDDIYGPVNSVLGDPNVGNAVDNDELNGNLTNIDEVDITVLDPADPVNPGDPVPVLDPLTGIVSVPAGTPADTYYITYEICEELNPNNCDNAIITVIVSNEPVAHNDDKSCNCTSNDVVLNILTNDFLGDGSQANPGAVSVDINLITAGIQTTLVIIGEGTWTYEPLSGNLTFDPEPGFTNNPTPLIYLLIENFTGFSDDATVTLYFDTEDPEFTACPTAPIDLGCNPTVFPTAADVVLAAGTVTDNCNVASVVAVAGAASGNECLITQTWTVTATDDCGNTDVCLVTYSWYIDTEDPEFTACPTAPIDLGCNPTVFPTAADVVLAAGTVTDNCNVASVVAVAGAASGNECLITQTWTVTATDDCGNTDVCLVTYSWYIDTEDPEFTACPTAPIDLGCNPTVFPTAADVVLAAGTVTDNCNVASVVAVAGAASGTECLITQTWTVTATDDCGNTDVCLVTYSWYIDTEDPEFTACPTAPIDLGCNPTVFPTAADVVLAAGTVTDNCNVASVVAVAGAASGTECLITQTWTVTATDDCGNTDVCLVTYSWYIDTEDPEFTACPTAPIDLGCNPTVFPTAADVVLAAGTVTDNCNVASVVAVAGAASGTECLITQTWTVTATDDCGNTDVCLVTYSWYIDTEDPEFTACPTAPIDLGCNPTVFPTAADVVLAAGAVTDNCNVASVVAVAGAASGTECLITQTWTVTATDDCGNTDVCLVTYSWYIDTEDPEFTACPTAPIDLGCNPTVFPTAADVVLAAGTVTDNCNVASVVAVAGAASGTECLITQTWTVTATDDCGNTDVCLVTYSWYIDTEDPEFTACPTAPIDLGCNPTVFPTAADVVLAAGTVTDNCNVASVVAVAGAASGTECLITQTWTVTATDDCGNTDVCLVTYSWYIDTEDPEFTACPTAPIDLGCNPTVFPTAADVVLAAGTVTDNCNVASVVAVAGAASGNECLITQTWTVTATDDCGNTDVCLVTYSWYIDTEDPEFTACPTAPIDLGCNPTVFPTAADVVLAAGTVTDNCNVASVVAVAGAASGTECLITQTWTVTATDDCGNTDVCLVTYSWYIDTEDPEFTACPTAPIDLGCNPTVFPTAADVVLAAGAVTDNCNVASVVAVAGAASGNECLITQTWTVTATDDCGNTDVCLVTYSWYIDTEDPEFTACPTAPIDLGCNPTVFPTAADVVLAAGTVTDNCNVASVVAVAGAASGNECLITQTWTVTATDDCGNTDVCLVTYSWYIDTEDPEFTACPTAPIDLGCNPTVFPTAADVVLAAGTVTDNCNVASVVAVAGAASGTECLITQTWTVTATDDCGNTDVCLVTYSWYIDTEDPEFTACPTAPIDLGCNPTVFPTAADVVLAAGTVTDNCNVASVVAVAGAASGTECLITQTWTVTATDDCGNTDVCLVTYSWYIDTEDPEFTACPTAPIDLGCNPTVFPTAADVVLAAGTVTDNCNVASVVAVAGAASGNECLITQTATDDCGIQTCAWLHTPGTSTPKILSSPHAPPLPSTWDGC
jgi:hypothetical protein